jgi:hypothetical protein
MKPEITTVSKVRRMGKDSTMRMRLAILADMNGAKPGDGKGKKEEVLVILHLTMLILKNDSLRQIHV